MMTSFRSMTMSMVAAMFVGHVLLAPTVTAQDTDPCSDPQYLELKRIPVRDMTDRQFEYFTLKNQLCAEVREGEAPSREPRPDDWRRDYGAQSAPYRKGLSARGGLGFLIPVSDGFADYQIGSVRASIGTYVGGVRLYLTGGYERAFGLDLSDFGESFDLDQWGFPLLLGMDVLFSDASTSPFLFVRAGNRFTNRSVSAPEFFSDSSSESFLLAEVGPGVAIGVGGGVSVFIELGYQFEALWDELGQNNHNVFVAFSVGL